MKLLALALFALTQPSADQFDLVCAGQEYQRLQGGQGEFFETRLRIDLAANRWCAD